MAKRKRRASRDTVPPPRGRGVGWTLWLLVGLTAAVGAFLLARDQATGGGEAVEPPARGLPATPDYHALFVFPEDPDHLLLGTHVGVYESTDGGVSWRFLALEGKDAMHFAREEDGTIWAAGHNVLERSRDGGRTWEPVEPDGLPGLDIHGFAHDAAEDVFYAAVAGEGLYRSRDGGRSYRRVSAEVGPSVYALAVTGNGIYAADRGRGVLESANGEGDDWRPVLDMETAGLAWNRRAGPGSRLLAAGEAVQLLDGTWRQVLPAAEGAGPVAFAPGDPAIAYAISFDGTLHRSEDGGETWKRVA